MAVQIAAAQSYITAGGIRIGNNFGLTLQQRVFENFTLEAIAQANKTSYSATLLGEMHRKLLWQKRFNYYFGGGGHYGGYRKATNNTDAIYGVTGIVGAEGTFGGWNVSIDYKPTYHLAHATNEPMVAHDFGLSIRFVIIKQNKKNFFKDILK